MRSLWLLLSGTAKIVSDLPSTRTRTNSDLGHFPNKPKPWYHTTGTPIPLDHNTILLVLLKRFQLLKAIKPSVFFLFSCLLSLRGNTLMSSKCISNPKAPRFEKENSCQWTTQPWRWIILIRSRCIACVARYILNFRLVVVSITTFKLHRDSYIKGNLINWPQILKIKEFKKQMVRCTHFFTLLTAAFERSDSQTHRRRLQQQALAHPTNYTNLHISFIINAITIHAQATYLAIIAVVFSILTPFSIRVAYTSEHCHLFDYYTRCVTIV